jgi:hypothetical protein
MKTKKVKRTQVVRVSAEAADAVKPLTDLRPSPYDSGSRAAVARRELPALPSSLTARVDVGWGNALFIRGQGGELSWEKGTPLLCAGRSTWVCAPRQANEPITCKLLLNDHLWAAGADLVVEPGSHLELAPVFHNGSHA